MKDKKGVNIVNAFQKIFDDSNRKPNKIWVDKGNEFCNNSFKKWLQDNDIAMYSTSNEGKSVVAERFIRHELSSQNLNKTDRNLVDKNWQLLLF